MITRDKIIRLIRQKNIPQKAINAIYAIITLERQEDDEVEHGILTNEKMFRPYKQKRFVTERFY